MKPRELKLGTHLDSGWMHSRGVGGGGGGADGGWAWGREGGTLKFVCYIGWAPASSVYPQKYTVCLPHPKTISANITPKNIRYVCHTQNNICKYYPQKYTVCLPHPKQYLQILPPKIYGMSAIPKTIYADISSKYIPLAFFFILFFIKVYFPFIFPV